VAFALLALALSSSLALWTYVQVQRDGLADRERLALRQAYGNARVARAALRAPDVDIGELLSSLRTSRGEPVVRVAGRWYAASVGRGADDIPTDLVALADDGHAGRRRVAVAGTPYVAVGIPVPAVDAAYFEFVGLEDLEESLATLGETLVVAALGATAVGALVGAWASARVLRPLREVAVAASTVQTGHLSTHIEGDRDPDLQPLVDAFNGMVDAVRDRIEREGRFASDVSHELRAPLAALAAGVNVARRHADDPARVQEALEIVDGSVAEFNRLVLDLLEISRLDAGVATLVRSEVDPVAFVHAAIRAAGDDVEVDVDPATPRRVVIDERRLGQAVVNLLDNARRYAGGATRVGIRPSADAGRFTIEVDDAGPGVPEHERAFVFERFARGATAGPADGTGLGLALVAAHVDLHGGTVAVTASPGGGARFVIDLPVSAEDRP
jgi:signal transduction histidine kinase